MSASDHVTAHHDAERVSSSSPLSEYGESGWWGAKFEAIQLRNPAFWVFAGLIAWGAAFLIREYASLPSLFRTVAIISVLLIVLVGSLFIFLTRAMDVFRAVPTSLAFYAFLWGAFPALNLIAIQANTAFLSIYAKIFGGRWAGDWATGLTAGFDEEIAKGLGFLLLLALARTVIVRPLQAFIVGAFIGLGFQFFENLSYAVNNAIDEEFGARATEIGITVLLQRFAEGLSSHGAYSAVFACGIFLIVRRCANAAGAACIIFSVGAHFVWDNAATIFAGWDGAIPVLSLLIAGTTFVVWVLVRRIEYQAAEKAACESFDMPIPLLRAAAGSRRSRRRFVRRGGERRHRAAVTRRRLVRAGRRALMKPHRSFRRSAERRHRFIAMWSDGERAR